MTAVMRPLTKDLYQQEDYKKSRYTLDRKLTKHQRVVYTALWHIVSTTRMRLCFKKSINLIETIFEIFGYRTTRQQINRSLKVLLELGLIRLVDTRKKTRYWDVNFHRCFLISKEKFWAKPKKKYKAKKVPILGQKSSQLPPQKIPNPIDIEKSIFRENIISREEHISPLKESLRTCSRSKARDDFFEQKKKRTEHRAEQYQQYLKACEKEYGEELLSMALTNVEARIEAQKAKGMQISCEYAYKKKAIETELKNLSLKPAIQEKKAIEEETSSFRKKNLQWLASKKEESKGLLDFSLSKAGLELTYNRQVCSELDFNMEPQCFKTLFIGYIDRVNKSFLSQGSVGHREGVPRVIN